MSIKCLHSSYYAAAAAAAFVCARACVYVCLRASICHWIKLACVWTLRLVRSVSTDLQKGKVAWRCESLQLQFWGEVVRLACCAANLMELIHVNARRFWDSWLAGDYEDLTWGVLMEANQSEQKWRSKFHKIKEVAYLACRLKLMKHTHLRGVHQQLHVLGCNFWKVEQEEEKDGLLLLSEEFTDKLETQNIVRKLWNFNFRALAALHEG